MKSSLLVSLLALGLVARGFAAEPASDSATIIDHEKMEQTFKKGGTVYAAESYKIQAGRRDADGQVEIHTHDTDIFYITQGSATLTTGGTCADAKDTAPGERRGTKIDGGVTRQLSKGDVVVIPAGMPHLLVNPTKPFLYFVVKVATK